MQLLNYIYQYQRLMIKVCCYIMAYTFKKTVKIDTNILSFIKRSSETTGIH